MTGALELFLRTVSRVSAPPRTNPGIGPGGWDSKALSNAQGQAPADGALFKTKTLYRIYTESVLTDAHLAEIIGRYFEGATVTWGLGMDARTQDASEQALIIEIVSSAPDSLQRIAHLAGDLRVAGNQISVLVTRQTVDTFEVTEP